jgi:hypothetical protein
MDLLLGCAQKWGVAAHTTARGHVVEFDAGRLLEMALGLSHLVVLASDLRMIQALPSVYFLVGQSFLALIHRSLLAYTQML